MVYVLRDAFTAGQCPGRLKDNLINIARELGVDPTNGTIVNLGARLATSSDHKDTKSNIDEAWNLFYNPLFRELRLRIVGFEGDPSAVEHMRNEFSRKGSRYELQDADMLSRVNMAYEFVDVRTVVRELLQRGVPHKFLLLKIDIDSFDFHVFSKIVRHFEPQLVQRLNRLARRPFSPAGGEHIDHAYDHLMEHGCMPLPRPDSPPDWVGTDWGTEDI